jgi:hypothetical protein
MDKRKCVTAQCPHFVDRSGENTNLPDWCDLLGTAVTYHNDCIVEGMDDMPTYFNTQTGPYEND